MDARRRAVEGTRRPLRWECADSVQSARIMYYLANAVEVCWARNHYTLFGIHTIRQMKSKSVRVRNTTYYLGYTLDHLHTIQGGGVNKNECRQARLALGEMAGRAGN